MNLKISAEDFFQTLSNSSDKTLPLLEKLTPENLNEDIFFDFAQSLSSRAQNFELEKSYDVCGTGGSGKARINLSTALALKLKNNYPIAKHGNKAASGKIGSFDLIQALGIEICTSSEKAKEEIKKNNVAFLFAPAFHPALKPLAPLRVAFGRPTIFNYLGPILNPVSNLTAQMIGVSNVQIGDLMAATCLRFGKKALIVHDLSNGLDDVSISGETQCWEILNGKINKFKIAPEDYGEKRYDFEDIKGGNNIEENKTIFKNLIEDTAPEAHLAFLRINQKVAEGFFDKT